MVLSLMVIATSGNVGRRSLMTTSRGERRRGRFNIWCSPYVYGDIILLVRDEMWKRIEVHFPETMSTSRDRIIRYLMFITIYKMGLVYVWSGRGEGRDGHLAHLFHKHDDHSLLFAIYIDPVNNDKQYQSPPHLHRILILSARDSHMQHDHQSVYTDYSLMIAH